MCNEAKDDGSGGENWSYKLCRAPVKSSTPTNQHPVFYRPDALPVTQPTASKHLREKCVDNNNKYKSTRSLNVTKSQLNRTFLKVLHNIMFVFEIFTTQTAAKLFVVRMTQLMRFQFKYCTKTLCALTTYIRLHTFMSK